jgi:DNA repair exonuclease SbcCD ATPase subunit
VIEADAPNNYQQIVTFSYGERLLVNNADLADLNDAIVSESSQRRYPKEYSEAIAQIKEQHQQELESLEQELRIGLQAEAGARVEAQVQEQIQSLQNLYKQQKEQNIQLQQRLDEMESLRQLETENQQLQQRIQELENAVQEHPVQQWGNTMTQQATKALNKQVKQALEKTIDLRSLAQEPPKENAQECLRLMGMALKNLSEAMNNTQALEAAAIILGSEPTPTAIAYRAEQLEMLPQAISDIRRVLAKPGFTWQDYWAVAQEYEVIKQDYWPELTTQETDLITALQKASSQPRTIGVGSIVAHADPYRTLYVERGEVIQDLGDEVIVAWDCWKEQSKKTDRYFRDELRFWQPQ